MLKADITLSDLCFAAEWKDGRVVFGDSRIVPYPHRLVETLLVRTEGQWFVVVRERLASATFDESAASRSAGVEEFNRLYRECLLWPLDYIMIEAAQAGCRMRVRAGAFGSAPVYCRASDDRIVISWDPGDVLVGPLAIDVEAVSHRLALDAVYSARQLCVGVLLLTERASLHVEPGKSSYRYPTPVGETIPVPLPQGQDAVAAFGELLQNATTARSSGSDRVAAELSGGMDSATVACALAGSCERVASLGIVLDGDVRDAQIQRRRRIVERLGLHDHTVDMAAHPPSVDVGPEPGHVRRLHWEYYLEASTALWDVSRSHGCDLLFTGIGGDELFPSYLDEAGADAQPAETEQQSESRRYVERLLTPRALSAARSQRSFDAPDSPVPATSLLAQACRAPDMLERGLWPVNPLSDPHLVAFCHRLPPEHRRGRAVMRRYLSRHLGEDVFPSGYVKETFVRVLPAAIARHAGAIAAQLRECALADLGLVEPKAALELVNLVATTRAKAPMAVLAPFLRLERLARQIG